MLYIKVHIDYIFPVFSCQKVIFFEFEDRSQEHETNKFSQQEKNTSQPIKLSVTSTANQIVYITLIAYTTYKVYLLLSLHLKAASNCLYIIR